METKNLHPQKWGGFYEEQRKKSRNIFFQSIYIIHFHLPGFFFLVGKNRKNYMKQKGRNHIVMLVFEGVEPFCQNLERDFCSKTTSCVFVSIITSWAPISHKCGYNSYGEKNTSGNQRFMGPAHISMYSILEP